MQNIEQLARDVAVAQDRLELAKRKLLAALGELPGTAARTASRTARLAGPTGITTSKAPPTTRTPAVSVAQRIRDALATGPKKRAELLTLVGPNKVAAVHSALKKMASAKRIESVDGKWRFVDTPKGKKKGPRP